MKTRADDIKTDIAKLRAQIKKNDAVIEEREHRMSLLRQYGDRLYNRLILLEAQLAREEAPMVKPEPPRVDVGGWSI